MQSLKVWWVELSNQFPLASCILFRKNFHSCNGPNSRNGHVWTTGSSLLYDVASCCVSGKEAWTFNHSLEYCCDDTIPALAHRTTHVHFDLEGLGKIHSRSRIAWAPMLSISFQNVSLSQHTTVTPSSLHLLLPVMNGGSSPIALIHSEVCIIHCPLSMELSRKWSHPRLLLVVLQA